MPTLKIDPHKSWIPLKEKADKTSNEKQKILLNEVANHMEAEIKGQLDPLMNTLTAEPVYHFWRVSDVNMILNGYEEVSEQFPSHIRAADSLYKLGEIYRIESNFEKASIFYNEVISIFPDAGAAQLSKKSLKIITEESNLID